MYRETKAIRRAINEFVVLTVRSIPWVFLSIFLVLVVKILTEQPPNPTAILLIELIVLSYAFVISIVISRVTVGVNRFKGIISREEKIARFLIGLIIFTTMCYYNQCTSFIPRLLTFQ